MNTETCVYRHRRIRTDVNPSAQKITMIVTN